MKKTILYGTLLALVVGVSSCSEAIHMRSKSATSRTRTVTQAPINEMVTVTDLQVDEKKVTGSYTGTYTREDDAKKIAVYDAVKKANADVLIQPLYEVELEDHTIKVNVSGFPGRYVNFRTPTTDDSLLMGWKVLPTPEQPKKESEKTEQHSGNCCCCHNCGGGHLGYETEKFSKPQPNPAQLPYFPYIPKSETKTTEAKSVDPKWFAEKLKEYETNKRRGRTELGVGLSLFMSGFILTGTSFLALDTDYGFPIMASIGPVAALAGIITTATGGVKLTRAARIKRELNNREMGGVAFSPVLNVNRNTFSTGFAMNF